MTRHAHHITCCVHSDSVSLVAGAVTVFFLQFVSILIILVYNVHTQHDHDNVCHSLPNYI